MKLLVVSKILIDTQLVAVVLMLLIFVIMEL